MRIYAHGRIHWAVPLRSLHVPQYKLESAIIWKNKNKSIHGSVCLRLYQTGGFVPLHGELTCFLRPCCAHTHVLTRSELGVSLNLCASICQFIKRRNWSGKDILLAKSLKEFMMVRFISNF